MTDLQKYDHKAAITDLRECNEMTHELMKTKHYQKIGDVGVFAIVQKAKSLNVSPLEALNGGLYFVQGKVEMSAQMMTQLIRRAGHSISKDPKSNDDICILHGKRKDNGDTWTESFSMKDADRAGLLKNTTWRSYQRDMLFNRALSRLARQLFADVIKGCYVERELSDEPNLQHTEIVETAEVISDEQEEYIDAKLSKHPDISAQLLRLLKDKYGIESLSELPHEHFDRTCSWIDRKVTVESRKETDSAQKPSVEKQTEFLPDELSDEQLEMALDEMPIEELGKELGIVK